MEVIDWLAQEENTFVTNLQSATNFPEDQLRTVIAMLGAIVCGFILRALPNNPPLKHVYNCTMGLLICVYTLGQTAWIHSFFSSIVVYGILKAIPPEVSHIFVFVFCMVYLSASHLYRQYHDYLGWRMDYTASQMILTLKLTSIAYNYKDGVAPSPKLPPELVKRSISKLPTLLEYFGWVYFFPTFLAGPAIEIKDYLSYVDMTMFSELQPKGSESHPTIPSTVVPTLVAFARSLIIVPFLLVSGYFPPAFLLTQSYEVLPFYDKVWLMHVTAGLVRAKYYFGWYLAEVGCIASGISYTGKDKTGRIKWDGCRNVYPLKIEFAQNMRDLTTFWNLGTSNWLKYYVYLRVDSKNPLLPVLATYITSAFWHGFYPGYYLFFVFSGIMTETAREIRRRIRSRFVDDGDRAIMPWKAIYDIICVVVVELHISFLGVAFIGLSWANSMIIWGALRYWGVYTIIASFILIRLIPKPHLAKKKD